MFNTNNILEHSSHYRCEYLCDTPEEASQISGRFMEYIGNLSNRTIIFNYTGNVVFIDTLEKQLTIELAEYINQNMKISL